MSLYQYIICYMNTFTYIRLHEYIYIDTFTEIRLHEHVYINTFNRYYYIGSVTKVSGLTIPHPKLLATVGKRSVDGCPRLYCSASFHAVNILMQKDTSLVIILFSFLYFVTHSHERRGRIYLI